MGFKIEDQIFKNSLPHFFSSSVFPLTKPEFHFQNVLCPKEIIQEKYKSMCNMKFTALLNKLNVKQWGAVII